MLRAARDAGTEIGLLAKTYMESGKLVPDDVVWQVAHEALLACNFDDFVLDGFPRTIAQADWFDADMESAGGGFRIVSLEVPERVILRRISNRRIHRVTGEIFHLEHKPPPPDTDPGDLIQRKDDAPEAVKHRLEVYDQETAPIKHHYRERGELLEVNGYGSVATVSARVFAALGVD